MVQKETEEGLVPIVMTHKVLEGDERGLAAIAALDTVDNNIHRVETLDA